MAEQENPLQKIIAKALQDEAFKQQLIADPAAVLKAAGVEVPEGTTLKVVADTESTRHIVLPARPANLSDEEISRVVGGEACTRDSRLNFDNYYSIYPEFDTPE